VASKQETIRFLREEGRQLVASKRYAQALEVFAKLGALEPAEAEWPRRAAECYGAVKRPKEQAEALADAAERFDKANVPNKAEAMCKLSLSIDSANRRARTLLDELERLRQQTRLPPAPTLAPRPSPTVFPRPSPTVFPRPSPTVFPRPSPTVFPRASSTVAPRPSPTVVPNASPAPTVIPERGPSPGALPAATRLEVAMRERRARPRRVGSEK
jgi:hypothetical protein